MEKFFITCLLGIVIGAIDVLPMIKMKLDKYSVLSAFVFYFSEYGLIWSYMVVEGRSGRISVGTAYGNYCF